MMWKLLFLLIATAAASEYEEEPSCAARIDKECETGEDRPYGMPGNEDELERFCKFFKKYFECVNRISNDCHGQEIHPDYLREITSVLTRVCDQDSLLYSALGASLSCFKKNEDSLPCRGMVGEEVIANFSKTLHGIGITDVAAPNADTIRSCMGILFNVGCLAGNAGKMCGEIAREVVVEIAQSFDTAYERCHPGVKDHLPEIARVMQLEAEKEQAVEEEIRKRKR